MSEEIKTVLCFSLEGQIYGIDIANVQEIVFGIDVTWVPCLPPYFCGLYNYKGNVLPVLAGMGKTAEQDAGQDVSLILQYQEHAFVIQIEGRPYLAQAGEVQKKTDLSPEGSKVWTVAETYIWKEQLISLLDMEKTIQRLKDCSLDEQGRNAVMPRTD